MAWRAIAALVMLTWLTPCFAQPAPNARPEPERLKPFPSAAAITQIDDYEKRLWTQAQEADDMIGKADLLLGQVQVDAYVQSVLDKLYPEFAGHVRAHVFRAPHANAFCLPNGSIYLNQGLLARMENEAQLASVLAHEGAHFTHRHGYAGQNNLKSAAVFASFTGLLGGGLLTDLLAISSISGYSRDLEREADGVGFQRMLKAGYDPAQAVRVFTLLHDEAKALDAKEPFFFASHPKLQERIDNFTRLAAKRAAGGDLSTERFAAATQSLRNASLEMDLSMNRQAVVIQVLENAERRARYSREADYFLGEAYRLRGKDGDAALAHAAYTRALATAPDFAPSYRALGIAAMKNKEYSAAAQHFEKYLALAPQAQDRGYVEQYLEMVKQKAK
jgi:beta-barrel assembly-enhancing protease